MNPSPAYLGYAETSLVRGGRPHLGLDGYVQLLNPLPESTVVGNVTFSARVAASLGATAVDFVAGLHTEGQPTLGYIPATKSGDVWTANTPWDSLIRDGVAVGEDYYAGVRVRVTTPTGVRFTVPTFVYTGNFPVTGVTPTYNAAASAWAANYNNGAQGYLDSYTNNGGFLWGADLTTTSIVPDPVPQGQGGHNNHGNVVLASMPDDYAGPQPTPTAVRWQAATRANNLSGMAVWRGVSIRLDPNHPTPTNSHISYQQFLGDPFETGLRMMLDSRTMTSAIGFDYMKANEMRVDPEDSGYGDPGPLFRMPFYRGQWVDFVVGMGVERDVRKGWIEIRYRTPGMTELKKADLFGIPGLHRVPRVLLPPNATGQRFHSHIYRSRGAYPLIQVMYAKERIGGSPEEVDPKSYGKVT